MREINIKLGKKCFNFISSKNNFKELLKELNLKNKRQNAVFRINFKNE